MADRYTERAQSMTEIEIRLCLIALNKLAVSIGRGEAVPKHEYDEAFSAMGRSFFPHIGVKTDG